MNDCNSERRFFQSIIDSINQKINKKDGNWNNFNKRYQYKQFCDEIYVRDRFMCKNDVSDYPDHENF